MAVTRCSRSFKWQPEPAVLPADRQNLVVAADANDHAVAEADLDGLVTRQRHRSGDAEALANASRSATLGNRVPAMARLALTCSIRLPVIPRGRICRTGSPRNDVARGDRSKNGAHSPSCLKFN